MHPYASGTLSASRFYDYYYAVNTAASGNYSLKLRVDPRTADTSLTVNINNGGAQTIPTLTRNTSVSWLDTSPVTVTLNAGLNSICLHATGATSTSIYSLMFGTLTNTLPWMDGMPGYGSVTQGQTHSFSLTPSDAESAFANLSVSFDSSTNTDLVANSGSVTCTRNTTTSKFDVVVTPNSSQYGLAYLTFKVSDGGAPPLYRKQGYPLYVNRSGNLTYRPAVTLTDGSYGVGCSADFSASTALTSAQGGLAFHAFDRNPTTCWKSPTNGFTFNGTWDNNGVTGAACNTQGHWIWMWLDKDAAKHFTRVKVVFGGSTTYARDFKLQYSDRDPNSTNPIPIWTDVPGGIKDGYAGENNCTYEFTGLNDTRQWLRLFVTNPIGSGGVWVKEMEVYDSAKVP